MTTHDRDDMTSTEPGAAETQDRDAAEVKPDGRQVPAAPAQSNPGIPAGAVPPGGPAATPQSLIEEQRTAEAERSNEPGDGDEGDRQPTG